MGAQSDIGNKEFIDADLEHRFLIIDTGNARARQYLHIALGFQEIQQRREVGALKSQTKEAAAQLGRRHQPAHTGHHSYSLPENRPLTRLRHIARIQAGTVSGVQNRTRLCRTVSKAVIGAAEVIPVNPCLKLLVQLNFDDFGFQHHLPFDDQLRHTQVVFDRAQIGREGLDQNYAGIGIDHHGAPVLVADNTRERHAQITPEIATGVGCNLATGRPRDRSRGLHRRIARRRRRTRRLGRHRIGENAQLALPLALSVKIINLEYPCLQCIGLNINTRPLHLVLVTIELAQRLQCLAHGHVFQIDRHITRHLGRHHHAIARTANQRHEYLRCRRVAHRQIETRFNALTRSRQVKLQGRHHRLTQCVLRAFRFGIERPLHLLADPVKGSARRLRLERIAPGNKHRKQNSRQYKS